MKRWLPLLLTIPLVISGCTPIASTNNSSEIQSQSSDQPEASSEPQEESLESISSSEAEPTTSEAEPTTSEAEPSEPVKLWSQTQSPQPAAFCKVPDQRPVAYQGEARGHTVNGIPWGGPSGFPLVEQTVPTKGELNWLFVMVAFEDTPKYVKQPADYLEPQIKKLEQWAKFWSQGKLTFNVSYVDYWVELPVKALDRPKDDGELANLILAGMPEGMRPDNFDATFVQWADLYKAPGVEQKDRRNEIRFTLRMGSNEKSYQGNPEALFWAPGYYHSSDQKQPLSLKRKYAYGHWLHEILHEMGLNLHAPGNGWATGVGQTLYPNQRGFSAAVNSWETFQLGWFDDDQVHCVDRDTLSETKTILTPIDTYGGERKMIAIPTKNRGNEVLVIEARQEGEWTDWQEGTSGLLAYRVDPTAEHRDHVEGDCGNDPKIKKWAYYIYPNGVPNPEPNCGQFDLALLKPGQSVSYAGITAKLEAKKDGKYYVAIEVR